MSSSRALTSAARGSSRADETMAAKRKSIIIRWDRHLSVHPLGSTDPLNSTHPSIALSVPVKLLKEGEGHMVTAELKTGEVYRGLLVESEDTMNLHLSEGPSPVCGAVVTVARLSGLGWSCLAPAFALGLYMYKSHAPLRTRSDAHGAEREGVEAGAGLPPGLPPQVCRAPRDTKERARVQEGASTVALVGLALCGCMCVCV